MLKEGWGQHNYVLNGTSEYHLVVEVTGPDGFATDYIDVPPYQWGTEWGIGGGTCNQGWQEFCPPHRGG